MSRRFAWPALVVTVALTAGCASDADRAHDEALAGFVLGVFGQGDEALLAVRRVIVVAGPPPADVIARGGEGDGTAAVCSWVLERPGHAAQSLEGATDVASRLRRRGLADELTLESNRARARPVEVARVVPFADHARALEVASEVDADLVVFVVLGREDRAEGHEVELRRAAWVHWPDEGDTSVHRDTSHRTITFPATHVPLDDAQREEAEEAFEALLEEAEDAGFPDAVLKPLRAAIELLLRREPLTPAAREDVVRGFVLGMSEPNRR